jgi:voltage-gated potassium channel Kch
VVFGCFYRIADGLSHHPLFMQLGEPARLDFSDALHFSVVTLATVGYGDIQPADDGIRLLAAIQILVGQLLLLFGFAEIMRSTPAPLHEAVGSHRDHAPGRADAREEPQEARREVAGE